MTKQEHDENDLLKILLSNQEKNNKSIVINQSTALIGTVAVIFFLVQLMIAITLWAVQDKLKTYDNVEVRVSALEKTVTSFDSAIKNFEKLADDFKDFMDKPQFTESIFNDKTKPIFDSLTRIEKSINDKNSALEQDSKIRDAFERDLSKRIDSLEREIEIIRKP